MKHQPKAANRDFEATNKAFAGENTLFGDLGMTGKKIKSMRERLGMTIREWAEMAGIGVASQHEIEHGTCTNQQLVLFSLHVVIRALPKAYLRLNTVLEDYHKEKIA